MGRQKSKHKRGVAGKVLMILALAGLAGLVVSHFTDFGKLVSTLKGGNWWWVAAGIGAHLVYFVCYSELYRLGFSIVGVKAKALHLLPVVFAGIFLNSVVPTGGAGAAALFIDDALQRRQSGAHAAVGVVLVLLLDLVTLLPFVGYGMWFLYTRRLLASYDWVGLALFLGYVGVLVAMLGLARWRKKFLHRVLARIRNLVNRIGRRFHKPELLAGEWPERTAEEFNYAVYAIDKRPGRTALAAGWAFVTHVVNLAGLWMLLQAFDVRVSLGGLVAAFGMGIIFFVVAVIPEGVAIVETVMTLIFSSLGVAKSTAITATLVFRTVNFWLPLAVGLFTLHRIRRFGERERHDESELSASEAKRGDPRPPSDRVERSSA